MDYTCRYCNARGTYAGSGPAVCHRCGEQLPFAADGAPAARATAPPEVERRATGWLWAGAVVGLLAVLAVLANKYLGRGGSPLEHVETAQTAAPAEWAALTFLPTRPTVLAGLKPAELVKSPAGQALWQQLKNVPGLGVAPPTAWEQVVASLELEGGATRFLLAAESVSPIDPPTLLPQFQAGRSVARSGKTFHPVRLGAAGAKALNGWLWLANDRALVLGLSDRDLENLVPSRERTEELGRLLREEVPADASIWAVASSADWAKTSLPALALFLPLPPELKAGFPGVESAVVSLTAGERWSLKLFVKCRDEAAVQQVAAQLAKLKWAALEITPNGRELRATASVDEATVRTWGGPAASVPK